MAVMIQYEEFHFPLLHFMLGKNHQLTHKAALEHFIV